MRKEKLRVIQYGCGKMGKVFLRYLHEKGAEIVGAVDNNPDLTGKDAGDVAELGFKLHVPIQRDAEVVFQSSHADVCIMAVASLMEDMHPHLELAVRQGVNVITTCEEAFYPWTTSPALTNSLDRLGKEYGCTICGSGYQDVFWGNLITVLGGATHRIDKIKGMSSYNVEDYGIALAEVHGAGLSPEEFEKNIAQNDALPSYMWNASEWLCSQLGWSIKKIEQKLVPTTHTEELKSSTLGKTIPAGHATGMSAVVTVETFQGPTLVTECVGKVYAPGEVDQNNWDIQGEPTTSVHIAGPSTVELTCATVVNRLPQVVEAPPGFFTTEKMLPAPYRTYPLHLYMTNWC